MASGAGAGEGAGVSVMTVSPSRGTGGLMSEAIDNRGVG